MVADLVSVGSMALSCSFSVSSRSSSRLSSVSLSPTTTIVTASAGGRHSPRRSKAGKTCVPLASQVASNEMEISSDAVRELEMEGNECAHRVPSHPQLSAAVPADELLLHRVYNKIPIQVEVFPVLASLNSYGISLEELSTVYCSLDRDQNGHVSKSELQALAQGRRVICRSASKRFPLPELRLALPACVQTIGPHESVDFLAFSRALLASCPSATDGDNGECCTRDDEEGRRVRNGSLKRRRPSEAD